MTEARIAVVEDDKAAYDVLRGYIDRFGGENGREFDVSVFTSASAFLSEYGNSFDIIFMDVELPDGNGIDAIKKIREKDDEAIVVFVTNMAQFAVRGYEVRAMDYVIKPVSYYNFSAKLQSALTALNKRRETFVWISNKDGKMRLNAAHITYVEVFQHMLVYHTVSGDYSATGSISSACEKLAGLPFSPCSRCYLVNLMYVSKVNGFYASVNGEQLLISKRMRSAFLKDLNKFIARGGKLKIDNI